MLGFHPLSINALSALTAVVNDIIIGGDDAPHGIYYQDQKRKKVTRKPLDKLLDKAVKEYYQEIIEEAPKSIQKKAAKLVRPYSEDKKRIPVEIDWVDFSQDIIRVRELLALYQQEIFDKQRQELIAKDDEAVILLAHEHDKRVIKDYFYRVYGVMYE